MRNLNRAQRVILVVSLGAGLATLGSFLQGGGGGGGVGYGWVAYAPLSSSGDGPAWRNWHDLVLWVILIAVWAVVSMVILRSQRSDRCS